MFSHATIGTNDMPRAVAFDEAAFACLGIERFHPDDGYAGNGTGMHIAFLAESRDPDGNKIRTVCHKPPTEPSG